MTEDIAKLHEEARQALLISSGIDIDHPDDSDEPGITLPHDENYDDALKKELYDRWKNASEHQQEILVYRYGLASGDSHSLEETAELFGVSINEVRQTEFKVFGHKQRSLNAEKLRQYFCKLREKKQSRWKYQW